MVVTSQPHGDPCPRPTPASVSSAIMNYGSMRCCGAALASRSGEQSDFPRDIRLSLFWRPQHAPEGRCGETWARMIGNHASAEFMEWLDRRTAGTYNFIWGRHDAAGLRRGRNVCTLSLYGGGLRRVRFELINRVSTIGTLCVPLRSARGFAASAGR